MAKHNARSKMPSPHTNQRSKKNGAREPKIRYAVVGLGHIAQSAVLPAFAHARSNSELVAFISDNSEKLRKLAQKYRVKALYEYDQLEECIETEQIDAVYIAVPNGLHREFAERAAHAGAHVLCEKPLGVNAAECREMDRITGQCRVYLMTAYRLHFDEANMHIVKLLKEGKIGTPKIFSSVFSYQIRKDNYRLQRKLGGGPLFDLGVYCINAARYIFRDEPMSVSAEMFMHDDERFSETESTCTAFMSFSNNRIAQFTCSFAAGDSDYFEVIGDKGSLRLNNAFEYAEACELELKSGEKTQSRKFKRHDQFAAELLYFSECIIKGREPEPSAREGLADLKIIDAIRQSAREGNVIEIDSSEQPIRRPSEEQVITRPPVREPSLVEVAPPTAE